MYLSGGVMRGYVNNVSYSGAASIVSGTWYHVAFTYDGSTATSYVDGVFDGSVLGMMLSHEVACLKR
ncbi:MAG: hypothetical protein JKY43_00080, partial [Phycisphaerales bacterium]|nr:hypothetical protein [Phycisphaerales bacterium]